VDPSSSTFATNSIRREEFISPGMYQIAKREEQGWRHKQAQDIKAMLFQSLKFVNDVTPRPL
jgi:hypothetical protein